MAPLDLVSTHPCVAAVIPAGGIGMRVGARTPKQFLRIDGMPVLEMTLRRIQQWALARKAFGEIAVAVPAAYIKRTSRLLGHPPRRPAPLVVEGGATRQESVWRALQGIGSDSDIVVVHDAVRPFVTRALLESVVDAAIGHGAAVCALPIAETVKLVRDGHVQETLDRSELWSVQTPQAFRLELLREAHEKARRDGIVGTDDAALVERLGHPVRVVLGSPANIKITTPNDLRRARRRR